MPTRVNVGRLKGTSVDFNLGSNCEPSALSSYNFGVILSGQIPKYGAIQSRMRVLTTWAGPQTGDTTHPQLLCKVPGTGQPPAGYTSRTPSVLLMCLSMAKSPDGSAN